jgi:hypothetical protein
MMGLILDALEARGFMPDEGGAWFDLPVGGHGALSVPRAMVRVELDDTDVIVYVMTGNRIPLWSARMSAAPGAVVVTVVDLAIAQAATGAPRDPGEVVAKVARHM